MKLLCIFILCVAFYEVNTAPKRFCGPGLVETLEMVCGTHYSHPNKRSAQYEIENFNSGTINGDVLTDDHVNTMAMARKKRNLLNIYEECCRRGCDFETLVLYCQT